MGSCQLPAPQPPHDLARTMDIASPSLSQNATYVRRLRCGAVAGDDFEDATGRASAGDAERRDVGLRVAVEISNVPFDQEGLSGVRDSPRRGEHEVDGADLVAAVPDSARPGYPTGLYFFTSFIEIGVLLPHDCIDVRVTAIYYE